MSNHVDQLNLTEALIEEFRSQQILAKRFPMLTSYGIADVDLAIHSHFLSYLAVLAQALGCSGIFECPLPAPLEKRWAALDDVRSDVIWFDKEHNAPVVAFEFERFGRSQEAKLRTKIENLSIAYLRSGKRLKLAVLVYWVRSGTAPRAIHEVAQIYQTGFVRNGVQVPPIGCPLHIFKCTWRSVAGGLIVSDILPVEVK